MKLLLLFSTLLVSTVTFADRRAPMVIATLGNDVMVFTTTSKLPYNMLLGGGASCFVGEDAEVAAIIQKAINNHQFAKKELVVVGTERYYSASSPKEYELTVKVENKVKKDGSFVLTFRQCTFK